MVIPSVHTIIVAAGKGSRFGANMPKQFCELAGRPVLMHTIDAFRKVLAQDSSITVVLGNDFIPFWEHLCQRHAFVSPKIVVGGDTRWHSVRNAVDSLHAANPRDIVLVHDGARPLVTPDVIDSVIRTAEEYDAAVPCLPVTDSLRSVDSDGTSHAVDRSRFRAIQTPQGFRYDILARAYRQPFKPSFTDDASVVENAGHPVALCNGHIANIKITNPHDIRLAELLCRSVTPEQLSGDSRHKHNA